LLFSTAGTWQRTKASYCYPLDLEHWPDEPEIVERVGLRLCRRRAAGIDLIPGRSDLGVYKWPGEGQCQRQSIDRSVR
jgi:hypothetical protein